jgi:ribulose-phosphate 3-epimerase
MSVVAPAILTDNHEIYKTTIERIHSFADRVHIDLADGEFAPTLTLGVDQLYWPANWKVDVHAMVARPSEYVKPLIDLHPNTIIFHAEVQEDLLPIMQQVKQAGIQAGLALLRPTVPKTIQPLIEAADHIMIFSGELGQYGGKASLMQLEKVRLIRNIKPNVEIGWDGGANDENAFSLAQGGIDVINAGAAINKADDAEAMYKKMTYETNRQRVI